MERSCLTRAKVKIVLSGGGVREYLSVTSHRVCGHLSDWHMSSRMVPDFETYDE